MANTTNRIFVDKMGGRDATEYVGVEGELFYDAAVGSLRLSDGVTAGGNALPGAGSTIDSEGNYIAIDNSTNTVSVANGATHTIPNFSGMLLINDHYDGGVECWICGGNGSYLISATRPGYTGSMQINGGVNGYEWTNENNLSGPFTFTVIKTRPGA